MNISCKSIYQLARNYAGLTQEEAAKKLHIGIRTLCGYEALNPVPNSDIVEKMEEVYGTKWLGYEHLRCSSRLGMKCLPSINIDNVAKSVLKFQKELNDIENIKSSMIAIACDGKIKKHEEEAWNNVSKELLEMAGAALAIVFSRSLPKEKRPSQMAV